MTISDRATLIIISLLLSAQYGCYSSWTREDVTLKSEDKPVAINYHDWLISHSGSTDSSNIRLVGNSTVEVSIGSSIDSSSEVKFFNNIDFNNYNQIQMNFSLKCNDIGLDDNGTGQHSFFSLQYDDKNYNIGFRIIIIGDRYKVDNYLPEELHNQLKIFRTDTSWHDWSFMVDVTDRTVSMERDGVYYSKHSIGQSQDINGISITVSGNESIPTNVQFKEVFIDALLDNTRLIANKDRNASNSKIEKTEFGDWPMFRKDRTNSAHSALQGFDFSNNKVAWSYSLGGFSGIHHTADLNNDGLDEILISYPGSLSAYDFKGKLIWAESIVNCEIYGLHDLNGDGKEELVIAGGTPKSIKVLDPSNGELLYNCEYDPTYDVVFVRIANLDPNTPGKNIIVTTRHEIGYCLSFDSEIQNGKVKFTFDWMLTNFIPAVAVADMDLDGINEIVVGTYSNFFVFDGTNGGTKSHLVADTGRNYGLMVVQDINGSGYPDIVMLASNLREHITVIENHDGKYLELLWDQLFEQNYPNDFKELRVYENSIFDYDGDGRTEILYGLFDELDGNKWRTYIVDALSGKEKYRIENSVPLGLLVQENTEKRFILLADNQPRKISSQLDLRVGVFESGEIKSIGKLDNARALYNDSSREFDLNTFSTSSAPRTFRQLDTFKDSFIISHGESGQEISVVRVSDDEITIEKLLKIPLETLPKGGVLNINKVNGEKDPIVSYGGQDTKMYFISNEKNVLCSIQAGGYLGLPLVASKNNGKDRSIFVHNSRNKLQALKENDGEINLIWEFDTAVKPSGFGAYQGRKMPLIGDFFNDGENLIAALSQSNQIVLINFNGEVVNRFEVPGDPIFISYGSFSGDGHSQLFVSYGDGTVSSKSTIINPDGSRNWTLSIGNGSPAIFDIDSDGYDDIVSRDLFERRSVDGKSGKDIYPITSWAGYHIPTVIENGLGDDPQILWSGGNYSLVLEHLNGKQKWWKPFMANRSPAGIADVNGDNKLEVGAYTVGQVYNWPDFYAVDGPNNEFVCYDLNSGKLLWKHFIGSPISGVITVDIDNDELPEFLFGTADGRLIALNGDSQSEERVVFERKFPASLGTPIITDLDGGGNVQILVGCADGNLYSLKPN